MVFRLRPYQEALIQRVRVGPRRRRAVLPQSPTGSGKTALSAHMMGSAAGKGRRATFIAHRQELVDQSLATFETVGIPVGAIAAGHPPDPRAPCQVASIDTLRNRWRDLPMPDLVVWDECRHVAAATWGKLKVAYSSARHAGLTATPERLDGKGLDAHFDDLVLGPDVRWLIDRGFLADYRLFAPGVPELAGVGSRAGDYARGQLSAAMDRPTITGDAVAHYKRLCLGRRAVAFAVSIEHSRHVVDEFRAAGFRAAHVDGTTPRLDRRMLIAAFRQGEIQVLSNVDLFGEGFDLPALEVAILLRPTKSLGLYLQQVGRALRPADGKAGAPILDRAGNAFRHGLPDDPRDWSLAGRPRAEKGPGPARSALPAVLRGACAAFGLPGMRARPRGPKARGRGGRRHARRSRQGGAAARARARAGRGAGPRRPGRAGPRAATGTPRAGRRMCSPPARQDGKRDSGMSETTESIRAWQHATFGPSANLMSDWARLQSEVTELMEKVATAVFDESLTDGEIERMPVRIAEEAADCVILLTPFFAVGGYSMQAAVDAKMAVNRRRQRKRTRPGHARHLPGRPRAMGRADGGVPLESDGDTTFHCSDAVTLGGQAGNHDPRLTDAFAEVVTGDAGCDPMQPRLSRGAAGRRVAP